MTTTTVIVNYQTPDLLDEAVRSFRAVYPAAHMLIVDNGSRDRSVQAIGDIVAASGGQVRSLLLDENSFHGPAMDLAMKEVGTRNVFFLDSDTVTNRGGFIEKMEVLLESEDVYAAGRVAHVNKRGFASSHGTAVPVSAYMMIEREKYLALPPFVHHGLPVLANFAAAAKRGWRVEEFPVDEYVDHLGRGTADRFGYGLGLRSRIDYLLNRLGL